ncbi:MAG: hypothetical protein ACLFTK_17685 [Anaerolineales bacterium]
MFANFFYRQLPPWARPSHPIMRYTLGYRSLSRGALLLRLLVAALLVVAVVAVAYVFTAETLDTSTPGYRAVMYYPLVGAQLLMQWFALALTTNIIALERQKGTWDSLQITERGAGVSVRARWALVFYRLRWVLLLVFLARLGFVGLLMQDMTDFEGRAIDVRIIGIEPEVSLEVAVFLLAALMTAAILQPFVALAFDAAVGLLVGTVSQQRSTGILTTVVLIALRGVVTVSALFLGTQILTANGTTAEIIGMPSAEAWARILFFSNQGDTSLRLLDLEVLGNLWGPDLEYGIFIGAAVLLLVVAQAALANLMVIYAAWRAGRPGRS